MLILLNLTHDKLCTDEMEFIFVDQIGMLISFFVSLNAYISVMCNIDDVKGPLMTGCLFWQNSQQSEIIFFHQISRFYYEQA